MERSGEFIRGLVLLILGIALAIFIAWQWLKNTEEDRTRLIVKWVGSALLAGVILFLVAPMVTQGGALAVVAILAAAVCGLVFAAIWTPNVTALLAKPFADLYDGGGAEPDPEPFYSIAIARRKQSKPLEAVAEVRKQLDRFPRDVVGHMLLAEIQAEDLNDLQAAQITIDRFIAQEGHAPKNIAYALNALADWQIKYAQDVEGARQTLARIGELLPDSEEALVATQRLSHMGDADYLLNRGNRPVIAIKAGVENLGLVKNYEPLKPVEEDKGAIAQKYVTHLETYPADMEIREKLALLYADHYRRLDLANDQIEQMIQQPGQPMKEVAHCLNLLADLQIKYAGDYEAAKQALERIIESYPKYAVAETARQRIAHLRFEMRALETKDAIKLGSYEQNIGLKKFKAPGVPE